MLNLLTQWLSGARSWLSRMFYWSQILSTEYRDNNTRTRVTTRWNDKIEWFYCNIYIQPSLSLVVMLATDSLWRSCRKMDPPCVLFRIFQITSVIIPSQVCLLVEDTGPRLHATIFLLASGPKAIPCYIQESTILPGHHHLEPYWWQAMSVSQQLSCWRRMVNLLTSSHWNTKQSRIFK